MNNTNNIFQSVCGTDLGVIYTELGVIYNYLLPVLLTISELLPFYNIKSNGIIDLLRNTISKKNNPHTLELELVLSEIKKSFFVRKCEFPHLYTSTIKSLIDLGYTIKKKRKGVSITW
jgi:hypothetical protein